MTAPEFSRVVPLARIGSEPARHEIAAEAAERAALSARFDLVAIDRLEAEIMIGRDGDGDTIIAQGRVTGAVVQSCVASGAPVTAAIDAPVAIRFVPEGGEAHDEIELDADACDEMPHDGLGVDIGEAAAQTLALALDPYPRAPQSDAALKAAGVIGEEQTGPFAALGKMLKT